MRIQSKAFNDGDMIHYRYTCDGDNISPKLEWNEVPDGTQSLALICDDPDAPGGTFVHWVLYNWPVGIQGLPEAVSTREKLREGALQGGNDFGKTGYGGPCPPGDEQHRYYFKLYALDKKVDLDSGASKAELLDAMEGHVLEEAHVMGKYKRR